jgi:hypothetical protein
MPLKNASTYFPTSSSYVQFVVAYVILVPISLFAMAISSITMIAYVAHKSMRKIDCAHLIVSLALCDFLGGCGGVIMGLARLRIALLDFYDFSRVYCIGTASIWLISLNMSHVVIAAIAIDRLIAMTWPFSYASRNHRSYATVVLSTALLAGFAILPLSITGVNFAVQPDRCMWSKFRSDTVLAKHG